MNIKFDFTQTGGFPLDQGVLNDLQNGILNVDAGLAHLAGPLVILSGCVITGGSAGNGVVAINGEVLPFVGGTITAKVIIIQTTANLTYFDGMDRPSQITRYATFGDDGVSDNEWVNFKRSTATGVIADIITLNGEVSTLNTEVSTINDDIATIGAEITNIEATMVKKLASGTAVLGDADPNHSDVGEGGTHTIPLGVTLPDTNYMVLLTVQSLSVDPQNDLYHNLTVRAKTTTSFDVYFRESAGYVQNVNLDWMAVAF